MADAVDKLAQLGRVIAYDRRGCARSDRPVPYQRTSVGEHADDAAALLDALAAAPAIVVGRSYGGTVATDLALRYPDRVRALVLLEYVSCKSAVGLSGDACSSSDSEPRVSSGRDCSYRTEAGPLVCGSRPDRSHLAQRRCECEPTLCTPSIGG